MYSCFFYISQESYIVAVHIFQTGAIVSDVTAFETLAVLAKINNLWLLSSLIGTHWGGALMSWCWTAIGNMLDRLGGVWTPAGGGATCYWNSPYTPQSHISYSDAEIKAFMELIIKECEPGNSSSFICRIPYISIDYFHSRDLPMGSDFFFHYIKVLINTSKKQTLKCICWSYSCCSLAYQIIIFNNFVNNIIMYQAAL